MMKVQSRVPVVKLVAPRSLLEGMDKRKAFEMATIFFNNVYTRKYEQLGN